MFNKDNSHTKLALWVNEKVDMSVLRLSNNIGSGSVMVNSLSRGAWINLYGPMQRMGDDINNPFVALKALKRGGSLVISRGTEKPVGMFGLDDSGKSVLIADTVFGD